MEKKIQPVLWAETVLLAVLALAALFPFVYMILTAMRQTYSMELNLGLSGLNLRNYLTIFKNFEFGKYLYNSVSVVVIACVLNAVISSAAAYGFEKRNLWEVSFSLPSIWPLSWCPPR